MPRGVAVVADILDAPPLTTLMKRARIITAERSKGDIGEIRGDIKGR
jgi:hypothetical protein